MADLESDAPLPPSNRPAPGEGVRTPPLISPPDSKTPPTATHKRHLDPSRGSEPVDAAQLSKALEQFREAGQERERTPGASPSRKRQRIYGDRWVSMFSRSGATRSIFKFNADRLSDSFQTAQDRICKSVLVCFMMRARPQRHRALRSGLQMSCTFSEVSFHSTSTKIRFTDAFVSSAEEANRTYSTLLRSEMFESTVPQSIPQNLSPPMPSNHATTFHDPTRSNTPPTKAPLPPPTLTPSTPHKNLFSYMSPRHHVSYSGHLTPSRTPHSRHGPNLNARAEIYSLSPIKQGSQMMLLSPRKTPRAVPKVPYKVLDAPDLADDFYLNLVDWGSQNILGVGLGQCVYMWNSTSGRVTKLCDLPDDTVTSVNWIQRVRSYELCSENVTANQINRAHISQSGRTRASSRFGTHTRSAGYEP
jgi:cell division cycle 20-like protein 1, cofactor of APC complex